MVGDDPFSSPDQEDATVVRPMSSAPGGGAGGSIPPASMEQVLEAVEIPDTAGLNPLEAAATPTLLAATQLKNTASHPDPAGLHRQLLGEIKAFDKRARSAGIGDDKLLVRAKYVLCAMLDDVVLNTPWGQASGWSHNTLQGVLFKKEWAGDEFFRLLDALLRDPAANRDLLELMYCCLALGFQGGYRVYNQKGELDQKREQLYLVLKSLSPEYERELSPHWRGITGLENKLERRIPIWAAAAVAALLLLTMYFFLYQRLSGFSDPVFSGLQSVAYVPVTRPELEYQRPVEPLPVDETPVLAHDSLRDRLLDEACFEVGAVILDDGTGEADKGTFIRTRPECTTLFASGKWDVQPAFRKVIVETIAPALAGALEAAPGKVLITGHTDNVPGRYMSNEELSQRRADSVTESLVAELDMPERFRAEGHGEREPVATNDTREGRAQNRRVEIVLLHPHVLL